MGLAALLMTTVVSPGTALAGGRGNGGGGKPGSAPGVLAVVEPVYAGSTPTVNGSAFKPGEYLLVGIPGDLFFTGMNADASGGFSFVYSDREMIAGQTYTMEAWSQGNKGWVKRASDTFTVQ